MGSDNHPFKDIFGQTFGPTLEELEHLGTASGLHDQVPGGGVAEDLQDPVQDLGLGVGEATGPRPVRSPSLDHVGGDRPGRSGEADQRAFGFQCSPNAGQGLADRGQASRRGLDFTGKGGNLRQGPQARTFPGLEPDFLAQGLGNEKNVSEDDGRIEGEPPHGLEGRLGGHLRIVTESEEVLGPGPELPVLGKRSSRLPHEPDRRPRKGFPGQGSQELGSRGVRHAALKPRQAFGLKRGVSRHHPCLPI